MTVSRDAPRRGGVVAFSRGRPPQRMHGVIDAFPRDRGRLADTVYRRWTHEQMAAGRAPVPLLTDSRSKCYEQLGRRSGMVVRASRRWRRSVL